MKMQGTSPEYNNIQLYYFLLYIAFIVCPNKYLVPAWSFLPRMNDLSFFIALDIVLWIISS